MATTFDFSTAEAAKETSYLKPGVYEMKVTEVKLDKFPKGADYLGITFETEDGLKFTEKMGFSSDKAKEVFLSRLQYLHLGWFNKKLDKVFKTPKEIEAYFAKYLTGPKAGARKIIIGGEISGKNIYGSLPFTNFIVPDDADLELGEFTEGDENWKKYVKKSSRTSEATGKANGVLNDDDDAGTAKTAKGSTTEAEDDDDAPW